jgi:hypothetical protein
MKKPVVVVIFLVLAGVVFGQENQSKEEIIVSTSMRTWTECVSAIGRPVPSGYELKREHTYIKFIGPIALGLSSINGRVARSIIVIHDDDIATLSIWAEVYKALCMLAGSHYASVSKGEIYKINPNDKYEINTTFCLISHPEKGIEQSGKHFYITIEFSPFVADFY